MRNLASRSATLAGLSVLAAYVSTSPAHSHCQKPPDQFAASHSDPRYPVLQQAVDTYFAAQQKTDGYSGIGVHLSLSPTGPTFNLASGSTSLENGGPICSDTLWAIGSISKSFTSVLLLKLEAEGVLDIHDTVGKWLPEYEAWSSYTIEQLLNMTALISDDYLFDQRFETDLVTDKRRTFTPAELVGYVYPGTTRETPWGYINTNYALADMIIAKASGMPYEVALKKMIFEPLQLESGYYQPRVPARRVLNAMPSGYLANSACQAFLNVEPPCARYPLDDLIGLDVKATNISVYGAAGGIIADLSDVSQWVRAMFGDTLLPAKQKAELFSLVSVVSGKPLATPSPTEIVGFSLGVSEGYQAFLEGPTWAYAGQTFGYFVQWFRRPGDDLVVVMAQNSSPTASQFNAFYKTLLQILEPDVVIHPDAGPKPERDPGQ